MAILIDSIEVAAAHLLDGGLVAFPTETVYGLGGNAYSNYSVNRIYEFKNRPSVNPLISHYSCADYAWEDVVPNSNAIKLADRFWPGPMTLILPKRSLSKISDVATASLRTVAVRVPAHPVANKLINLCGFPIVAPSANKSTTLSPTTSQMVMDNFADKNDLLIIDGGDCSVGIESTIIDTTNGNYVSILRYGIITPEEISNVCELRQVKSSNIAPGMMFKHYSPKHKLVTNSKECSVNDAYLDFGDGGEHKECAAYLNLSIKGELREAAINLFSMLNKLDSTNCDRILVAPIPCNGIGIAINDRIKRAEGMLKDGE